MKKSKYGKASLLLMSVIIASSISTNSAMAESPTVITDTSTINTGVNNAILTEYNVTEFDSLGNPILPPVELGGGIYNVSNSGTLNIGTEPDRSVIFNNIKAAVTVENILGDVIKTERKGGVIYNTGNLYIGCQLNSIGGVESTGSKVTFSNNIGSRGGAITNGDMIENSRLDGTAYIHNTLFESNLAERYIGDYGTTSTVGWDTSNNSLGGAIANLGTLDIKETSFLNNVAGEYGYGGAIYNGRGGSVTINGNSIFKGNSAGGAGGAIFNNIVEESDFDAIVTVNNGTFDSNYAGFEGGAIVNQSATGENEARLNINNSTFTNNSAKTGGAICNNAQIAEDFINYAKATLNIDSSDFSNNGYLKIDDTEISARNGGAIHNDAGVINITGKQAKTTFINNIASRHGGAIYNVRGNINIDNAAFTGNYAQEGGAIFNAIVDEDSKTSTITIKNSSFDYNGYPIEEGSAMTSDMGGAIYNNGGEVNISENSNFSNNVADSEGGAIYNTLGGVVNIESTTFTNNGQYDENLNDDTNEIRVLTESGGAIYNNATMTIVDSSFTNNAAFSGGAIHNAIDGVLNLTNVTFSQNTSTEYDGDGGAIFNEGKINQLTGTFTENTSHYNGGAITNLGEITSINGTFTANKTLATSEESLDGNGGAIDNDDLGNIGTIVGLFDGNIAANNGGAISNNAIIGTISAEFKNNSAQNGGAIYNNNEKSLEITNSNFNENKAIDGAGGAIYGGILKISNSTFDNNSAYSEYRQDEEFTYNGTTYNDHIYEYDGEGGAIIANNIEINNSHFTNNLAAEDSGAIGISGSAIIKNSTFKNNAAKSYEDEYYHWIDEDGNLQTHKSSGYVGEGGALSVWVGELQTENSLFENNIAGDLGGAIYSIASNTVLVDTDFAGNSAINAGGAIYATNGSSEGEAAPQPAPIKILALNKDVKFSGNTAAKGGDIYLSNNTLYLNANQDKTMSFDGGIVGNNAVININDSSINSLYENLTSTGKIIIDNYVSADTDSTLSINLNGGILKLGQDDYLNGTNLTLNEGSTLDLINDKAGMMNLNSLNANNANLNIDVDLALQNIDTLNGQTISGTLNLKEINLLSDLSDGVNSMTKELGGLNIITPQDGISVATHDYIYNVKANNGNLSITRPVTESGDSVKTDGFTIIFNQNDSIGGLLDVNLSDDRIFSAIEDIIITGINSVKGWLGELEGNSLTIEGNGNNLEGGDNIAIIVNVNQTLNFNDTNIKGFETNDDRKGALTVKDGGTLNIHAKHHDVELKTDNDRHNNAIYMEGNGSKSNLTTSNGKKIDVHNDIRSSNQSNHMHLKGNGRISFKGIVDPLTITNENADTVHENYIDDVIYNLNSGTVSFTKDEYLNGQGNKNVLNFNGGTLNIANNAIGNIDLASLNLNSSSNIMVDADLANKTMDRIIADSVSANTDAKLNVSHINLLSDAKEDSVSINAVDPSVTLAGGETFASHISTTVKEVAYSPLYKYTVDYNSSTGDFSFTRPSMGGSSGSTGAPNYNSLNPAVMTSPVSAQLGGYVNMVETYNNAFNNMDMRMLTGSALRYANKNANRYAISEGNYPHFHTTPNTGAMWVRPFASYDSVGLKNGPSVSSFSYGTFLGGDTAIHHFGNGAEGVLSVHASYLGSHQSFAGNSIYNNGGNLGLTSTIYKGNFFNGLTFNIGASVSDASTMYGSEDFPMLMSGVANKMGYNFEFKDGRFIVQPSLLLSYTFVNTFDYTNGAGVRIDSDPLHAMQISPNVRFAMNTQGGWQPYLTVGMNWNLFTDTEFKANDLTLPYLSVKPYVQYGVGIQRVVNDNFTAFAQVLLRHGGRNGVAGNLGLKFMIGEEVL